MTVVLGLAGLVALVVGAEILVRGASALAGRFGISPLVVGLTIVAFGTSAPELAVSLQGALSDSANVAVGNVLGSNIFNVLIILGVSALIAPLVVAQQFVRREVPIMVGATLLAFLFAFGGGVSRLEGLILFAGFGAYTVFTFYRAREVSPAVDEEYEREFGDGRDIVTRRTVLGGVGVVAGLALLVLGANWLVDAAVEVARQLQVSDLVISLTIVAAGTSMPELATSLMAAIRGERDIAVGNVVGSNIFNLLVVLGLAAAVAPGGVEVSADILRFDMLVVLAISIACLPVFFSGYRIDRWEGGVFVVYYVVFVVYMVLEAIDHAMMAPFETALFVFVIPLTSVTLLVILWRSLRGEDAPA